MHHRVFRGEQLRVSGHAPELGGGGERQDRGGLQQKLLGKPSIHWFTKTTRDTPLLKQFLVRKIVSVPFPESSFSLSIEKLFGT